MKVDLGSQVDSALSGYQVRYLYFTFHEVGLVLLFWVRPDEVSSNICEMSIYFICFMFMHRLAKFIHI